jgi:hypothetical protein
MDTFAPDVRPSWRHHERDQCQSQWRTGCQAAHRRRQGLWSRRRDADVEGIQRQSEETVSSEGFETAAPEGATEMSTCIEPPRFESPESS